MKTPALFKIASATAAGTPTIDTPRGPIYAGTPAAARYLEVKAVADALGALVDGIKGMTLTKTEALAAAADLLAALPIEHQRMTEDLRDFRNALETGRDFANALICLEQDHLSRVRFGLSCAAGDAPGPAHSNAITKDDPRHPEHPLNPTQTHKSARRNA